MHVKGSELLSAFRGITAGLERSAHQTKDTTVVQRGDQHLLSRPRLGLWPGINLTVLILKGLNLRISRPPPKTVSVVIGMSVIFSLKHFLP